MKLSDHEQVTRLVHDHETYQKQLAALDRARMTVVITGETKGSPATPYGPCFEATYRDVEMSAVLQPVVALELARRRNDVAAQLAKLGVDVDI